MNASASLAVFVAIFLSACSATKEISGIEGWPTEQRQKHWISENHLIPIKPHEITAAQGGEVAFESGVAVSPDGQMRIVFKMGDLRRVGDLHTSTSRFEIMDRNGKPVATAQATSSRQTAEYSHPHHRAWFYSDGRILIYESWSDGSAYHDTVALISQLDSSAPRIDYLKLPAFPYPIERGAIPMGLLGNYLLLKPETPLKAPGYKVSISKIPREESPLPFSIG